MLFRSGNRTAPSFKPTGECGGDAEKGDFPFFMLKEIFSQPRCLTDAAAQFTDGKRLKKILFSDEEANAFNRVKLIGCGSAYHAGVAGKNFIERLAGIPAEAELAGEFRYRDVLCDEKTLALFISQSGETADTLFALRHAKAKGAATLAVVNTPLSSIAREADKTVHTRAGTEIAVATTKAYSTQLVLIHLLMLCIAQAQGKMSEQRSEERRVGKECRSRWSPYH